MRIATIIDGKVDNIIEAESVGALAAILPEANLVASDTASPGDQYDGLTFTSPVPAHVDLGLLKAAKNEQINRWREAANFSSFHHQGKQIACDSLSRSDIDGVANHIALFGSFPAGFPHAWKAVDNSYVPLPAVEDFKSMYASMTAQGTANFERAQGLKQALAAAVTPEEVAAISW